MDTPERFTDRIAQYDARLRDTVRRCGWAVQAVIGDGPEPPFAYTVGLAGFGHPELVLFATGQATAAVVLNDLGELVRGGRRLAAGEEIELPNGPVHLLEFPDSADWLLAADQLYRRPGGPPVPALLVLPVGELTEEPGADQPCSCCQPVTTPRRDRRAGGSRRASPPRRRPRR